MRRFVPLIVGTLVIAGGAVIVGTSMSGGVYSLTVAEALAQAQDLQGRQFKVSGDVVDGSVVETGDFSITFTIRDESNEILSCRYKGVLPDPFEEGRQVILQGTFDAEHVLEVSQITVKCPSKYEEEGYSEEEYLQYYGDKYKNGHPGANGDDAAK